MLWVFYFHAMEGTNYGNYENQQQQKKHLKLMVPKVMLGN